MKKVTYILGIIGLILAGGLAAGAGVSAETKTESAKVQFTFSSKATVEIPDTDLVMTMDGGGGLLPGMVAKSPTDWKLTVRSNDNYGYAILASAGSADSATTDLVRTRDVANEEVTDTVNKFTSLASDASLASLTAGTWGYRICTLGEVCETAGNEDANFSNYSGLSAYNAGSDQENAKTIRTASKQALDQSEEYTTTYFQVAAHATDDQMPGTYTTTINFYVVALGAPM